MSAFNSAWHVCVFMKGSGDASRRCVLSLVRAIFSASASRCRPANFIWSEWRIRALLRDYSSCVIMNWGRCTTSNDEFCERKTTRSSLLGWCPCSCMRDYSFIAVCPIITSLSSRSFLFHLSVRVKWKSEVLHFRSFSPFKEKGRTLFAVLDKCAVTMVRTVTFPRSL